MANSTLPDWHDMQGLIVSAYPHLPEAEYVPLSIDPKETGTAREWFREMAGQVTTAFDNPKFVGEKIANVNIAVSYTGLKKLWRASDLDREFPYPFVEGIDGSCHRSGPHCRFFNRRSPRRRYRALLDHADSAGSRLEFWLCRGLRDGS